MIRVFFSLDTERDRELKVDLNALVMGLRKEGVRNINENNASEMIINKTSTDGRLKVRLIFERLSGKLMDKTNVEIKNIGYVLMLGYKE